MLQHSRASVREWEPTYATEPRPERARRERHPPEVERRITKVASHNCTVLVTGESGTGKELVAAEIHRRSARCGGRLVTVDCSAVPDTLFESLLFGHAKGAYTGADTARCGFFRAADGGTLFLDEVGELPLSSQAKLLCCIQEKRVVPVGMHTAVAADVRVVAATHRDLWTMARMGQYREDLYYRLNVVTIHLPPLRERGDEVISLAKRLSMKLAAKERAPDKYLAADAIAALRAHTWPGNIRELANAIEHAYVMSDSPVIHACDLPENVRQGAKSNHRRRATSTLDEIERAAIADALRATHGNKTRAADRLGITRQSLYRLITRYGLSASV